MVHIIGASRDPAVAIFKSRTGVVTRWWLEEGVLKWEDSKGQEGQMANADDAAYRLRAIAAMKGMGSEFGIECDAQDRKAIGDFIEKAAALIKKMRERGTPYDRLRAAGILRDGGRLTPKDIATNARIRDPRKTISVSRKFFD